MDEEQRLNFNSFVDAYNAYQNPNLAAAAPAFAGYGYEAPQLNMVQAPNQFPQMSINPDAIYDPSVAAAMQILNQPMMMAQTPGLLGAGTDYQTAYSLLKEIAPTKLQQYQKIAPPPPPPSLMRSVGGGGDYGSGDYYGGDGRGGSDLYTYDPQRDAQSGGSRAPSWVSPPADMIRDSSDNSIDSQRDDQAGGSRGESWQSLPADMRGDSDGGGGGKIICTAMNQAYGFGSFRNAIWIAYADKHLTKAHEAGYHALFLPLVDFAFKRGDGKVNVAVRKVMEWGTRHRSTDLRAEMRGTKRDTTGRIIRMIFEPLCYAVGKLKGK